MRHADGSVKHPGVDNLDNHGMGTIFEELVRRFNEENNEEAGEHWTPRDPVRFRPPRSATMPSSSTHMHSVRLAKRSRSACGAASRSARRHAHTKPKSVCH
ncbi:MAG: hypothetical protein OXP69_25355 [Spirochaetaceae bacterium]|nr:hypothetical protein [Spirochaetaceae bacterium]